MVERVARALVPDAWHQTEYPDGSARYTLVLWEEEQARARKLARAAIAAMREPTHAVITAGAVVILRERDKPTSAITISGPTWRAMIDEALK